MGLVLGILKGIGIVIAALMILVLILLTLILFIPVRYSVRLTVRDPDGLDPESLPGAKISAAGEESSQETAAALLTVYDYMKGRAGAALHIGWLAGQICLDYDYPSDPEPAVTFFRLKRKLSEILPHKDSNQEDEPPGEEEDGQEKEDGGPNRLEKIFAAASREEGRDGFLHILRVVSALFGKYLPGQWSCIGTIGLGDVYYTGRMMELAGWLVPLTADHVEITPAYNRVQCHLESLAEGKIRLIFAVTAVMRILLNRNCRFLIRSVI